jgi:hypothetical protein
MHKPLLSRKHKSLATPGLAHNNADIPRGDLEQRKLTPRKDVCKAQNLVVRFAEQKAGADFLTIQNTAEPCFPASAAGFAPLPLISFLLPKFQAGKNYQGKVFFSRKKISSGSGRRV